MPSYTHHSTEHFKYLQREISTINLVKQFVTIGQDVMVIFSSVCSLRWSLHNWLRSISIFSFLNGNRNSGWRMMFFCRKLNNWGKKAVKYCKQKQIDSTVSDLSVCEIKNTSRRIQFDSGFDTERCRCN